mgnify:FL=1|tara:strand:+ start:1616 stop:1879 length:264 start_codon:yes stop_codon:yes gene_type:complete
MIAVGGLLMSKNVSWYDKFSSIQLVLLGFLLLGVTPLIRNPEYLGILINSGSWNTPEFKEVVEAIFTDGCIGAMAGLWFVFRKRGRS